MKKPCDYSLEGIFVNRNAAFLDLPQKVDYYSEEERNWYDWNSRIGKYFLLTNNLFSQISSDISYDPLPQGRFWINYPSTFAEFSDETDVPRNMNHYFALEVSRIDFKNGVYTLKLIKAVSLFDSLNLPERDCSASFFEFLNELSLKSPQYGDVYIVRWRNRIAVDIGYNDGYLRQRLYILENENEWIATFLRHSGQHFDPQLNIGVHVLTSNQVDMINKSGLKTYID